MTLSTTKPSGAVRMSGSETDVDLNDMLPSSAAAEAFRSAVLTAFDGTNTAKQLKQEMDQVKEKRAREQEAHDRRVADRKAAEAAEEKKAKEK